MDDGSTSNEICAIFKLTSAMCVAQNWRFMELVERDLDRLYDLATAPARSDDGDASRAGVLADTACSSYAVLFPPLTPHFRWLLHHVSFKYPSDVVTAHSPGWGADKTVVVRAARCGVSKKTVGGSSVESCAASSDDSPPALKSLLTLRDWFVSVDISAIPLPLMSTNPRFLQVLANEFKSQRDAIQARIHKNPASPPPMQAATIDSTCEAPSTKRTRIWVSPRVQQQKERQQAQQQAQQPRQVRSTQASAPEESPRVRRGRGTFGGSLRCLEEDDTHHTNGHNSSAVTSDPLPQPLVAEVHSNQPTSAATETTQVPVTRRGRGTFHSEALFQTEATTQASTLQSQGETDDANWGVNKSTTDDDSSELIQECCEGAQIVPLCGNYTEFSAEVIRPLEESVFKKSYTDVSADSGVTWSDAWRLEKADYGWIGFQLGNTGNLCGSRLCVMLAASKDPYGARFEVEFDFTNPTAHTHSSENNCEGFDLRLRAFSSCASSKYSCRQSGNCTCVHSSYTHGKFLDDVGMALGNERQVWIGIMGDGGILCVGCGLVCRDLCATLDARKALGGTRLNVSWIGFQACRKSISIKQIHLGPGFGQIAHTNHVVHCSYEKVESEQVGRFLESLDVTRLLPVQQTPTHSSAWAVFPTLESANRALTEHSESASLSITTLEFAPPEALALLGVHIEKVRPKMSSALVSRIVQQTISSKSHE
ncbi:hypothetical protein Pelo_13959 [Pelomyxa schiedti]|nr:hypothetical protein Pelo_13959 [Pelomyxa schiedti]